MALDSWVEGRGEEQCRRLVGVFQALRVIHGLS